MKRSFYSFDIKLSDDKYVVFNTKSGSIVELDRDEYLTYSNCYSYSDDDNEIINELEKQGLVTSLSTEEEKELVYSKFNFSKYFSSLHHFTILTTTDCNYHCYYCYENGVKRENMSDETIENTIKYIEETIKSKKLDNVSFTWLGGEPLKYLLPAEKIYNELKEGVLKEYDVKTSNNTLVTNGFYFSDEILEKMKMLDIKKVQITFDGGKATHEKVKPGSYDKLIDWISILAENGIVVNARVNVDNDSLKTFDGFLSDIENKVPLNLMSEGKFSISPFPVYSFHETAPNLLQMKASESVISTEINEKLVAFFERNEIYKLTDQQKMQQLKSIYTPLYRYCAATHLNSSVINSDGTVYKCWDVVGHENEVIYDVNNPSAVSSEKYQHNVSKWINYSPPDECKQCKFLPCCGSVCPYKVMLNKFECNQLSQYEYFIKNLNEYISLVEKCDVS